MKTIKQASIHAEYFEYIPRPIDMKPGVIYVSRKYQTSSHFCLCGCGHLCVLPLKEGEWTLSENEKGVCITPSILQRFECKSHYIVTNGIANFV